MFLRQEDSFLMGLHISNSNKIRFLAVETNARNFRYLGKILRNLDVIFETLKRNEERMRVCESERLRKSFQSPCMIT